MSEPADVLEVDPGAPRRDSLRAPAWTGPVAGLVAAATALAAGLVVAAIIDVDSPLNAVGSEFIDHTPHWLKTLAISAFGTNDKTALRAGMLVVIGLLSLVVGAVARRRPLVGWVSFAMFGVLGAVIAVGRPGQGASAAIPAVIAGAVGSVVLWGLLRVVRAGDGPAETPGSSRAPSGWDRRRFVTTTAGAAGVAVVTAGVARSLERRRLTDLADAAPSTLPPLDATTATPGLSDVSSAAPPIPPTATVSPVTPFITPNDDFYLIDTALSVPRINVGRWSVQIGGMVDRPLTLTYQDLLDRPQVERVVTISCVSNEIGGDLVGNAVWQGVLLADVLTEAGVQSGVEQVFSTSVDGWTCGFPIEAALDGRDALIAVGMNGEPLPLRHGFPARLIIPGLYGYVSATKWLEKIELTTWDAAEGYWVPRGWSREAPIKTQSRIDVPARGEKLKAGTVAVAGIAWAPRRKISKVELRIDDGAWVEATLADEVGDDSWRQWRYAWDATAGSHKIQVRATDGNGDVQIEEVSRPDPDGATGWHTRTVSVG